MCVWFINEIAGAANIMSEAFTTAGISASVSRMQMSEWSCRRVRKYTAVNHCHSVPCGARLSQTSTLSLCPLRASEGLAQMSLEVSTICFTVYSIN